MDTPRVDTPSPARQARAELAAETLRILSQGHYTRADGQQVHIADRVDAAAHTSRLLAPGDALHRPLLHDRPTAVTLRNETTLAAGRRLAVEEGLDLAILNFASARRPGGGFLNGSEAQEESLARSSALYACLEGCPMYDHNRHSGDALYSHHMVYSPGVPVFRDDTGALLDEPWVAAFITAPAVNAGVARKNGVSRRKIREVMRERAERVLLLAASAGHHAILLGAWGCGVFRNDPAEVADIFRECLEGELRGVFSRVHFAIYDNQGGRFFDPFQAAFPEATEG